VRTLIEERIWGPWQSVPLELPCPLCSTMGTHKCHKDGGRMRHGPMSTPDEQDMESAKEQLHRPDVRVALDEIETKNMHQSDSCKPDSSLPFRLSAVRGLRIIDADGNQVVDGSPNSSDPSWTAKRGDLQYIVNASNHVGSLEQARRDREEDDRDNQQDNDRMLRALDPGYVAGEDQVTYEQAADLAQQLRAERNLLSQRQHEFQQRSSELLDRARVAEGKLREAEKKIDQSPEGARHQAIRDFDMFMAGGIARAMTTREIASVKLAALPSSTLSRNMGVVIGVLLQRPFKDAPTPQPIVDDDLRDDSSLVDLLCDIKRVADRGTRSLHCDSMEEWAVKMWDVLPVRLRELAKTPITLDRDGWTTTAQLPPGTLFETEDGIRAVKSNSCFAGSGPWQCVLLDTGEYAKFVDGNQTRVREIIIDQEDKD